jgi:hypothetical protein
MDPIDQRRPAAASFATTQWSVVLGAGAGNARDASTALATLCQSYWYPLYAYVRRRVKDASEAQDLTQEFFAGLIERGALASAAPDRGRFRCFCDSRYRFEPAHDLTPERLFERKWAMTLLDLVLGRLRDEYAAEGKSAQFELLRHFIGGNHAESSYAEAAGELDMSEGAAKVAAHRLRRRYRDLLRQELAQTVADPADVDDEISWLFTAIG